MRGFDAAYCFGPYEGELRKLIHLYKYSGVRTLEKPLGDLLNAAIPARERFDAITAVPLHWRRQWQRGYNQSELLVRRLAAHHGIPAIRALERVRATRAQAGLSNNARRRNVAAAFHCRKAAERAGQIAGKRLLLVDDVMTTGSTAASCAQVLKRAGAERVILATVARVDRRLDAGAYIHGVRID